MYIKKEKMRSQYENKKRRKTKSKYIIKNSNTSIKVIMNVFKNYYLIIIFILIITMIINNINGI